MAGLTRLPTLYRLLVLLFLLIPSLASAAESTASMSGNFVAVTPDIITAKLKEVEASSEVNSVNKGTLTELYRKALSNLEKEQASTQAANSFSKALKTIPSQVKAARAELEKLKRQPQPSALNITTNTPLFEVEQELLNEKADQSVLEAKLYELKRQLTTDTERPAAIRNQIIEGRNRHDLIGSELKQAASSNNSSLLSEAKKWNLMADQLAIRAELKMLDQELLSQPLRLELMKIQQETAERRLDRLNERIKSLEQLLNQIRRTEAEQARTDADVAKIEMAGKHPLIRELAEKNAELSDYLTQLSAQLEKVSTSDFEAHETTKRIEDELQNLRQKLEVAGLSQSLGRVLLERRNLLPEARNIRREIDARENLAASASLKQLQNTEELRKLRDISGYVEQLTSILSEQDTASIQADIKDLAEKRRVMLDKESSQNEIYLRALGELDFAQNQLINAIEAYDTFLAERLLWVRSAPLPDLNMLLGIPAELYELLNPRHWLEVAHIFFSRLLQSPAFIIMLLVFSILLGTTRLMHKALARTGKKIVKASTDRLKYTFRALGLTLLMAAPWPLLTGVTGWQLSLSLEASDFTRALSQGLILLSPAFFYLKSFRTMCLSDGLARVHFRWPTSTIKALRYQLRILMLTFLPAALVAITTISFSSAQFGSGLGRLAFVVVVMALSYFFYRLFSSKQSILKELLEQNPNGTLARFRTLWLTLALLLPALLVILAISGFLYTAIILTGSLVQTMWLFLGLIVIHQLAVRWLLMTRRKLALEAVLERRRAALEAGEQGGQTSSIEFTQQQVEEPEIDLFALNEDSRKLLNTALPLLSLIGLWFIWSDMLPAFGWLNTISIWHYREIIGDAEQMIPVTLADLVLAIILLIATIVASKRFPALLEIILLQHFSTTSGGRYAATKLARYSIAAIGFILILSVIGVRWSQLQWLVAALGVGIGFGLQEIVANFISGLIILFERPIRVGDVVTIGETDGVVTRIHIRATTIRSWDRQELLVPNKEFITGRLLNWSLSDQTTRLRIPVGIAYGSDVQKAMSLMNEAAQENDHVLADPESSVTFEAFGDSTLNLELRCFVGSQDDRMPTRTALHQAINQKFNDAGIVIAFPQRDVHLDTSKPLDIRIHQG